MFRSQGSGGFSFQTFHRCRGVEIGEPFEYTFWEHPVRLLKAVADVRSPVDYAGGHIHNGVNIGLMGQFATWAGSLLSPKIPITLIADPDKRPKPFNGWVESVLNRWLEIWNQACRPYTSRADLVKCGKGISPQVPEYKDQGPLRS
jgi:hypothetical protein